MSSGNAINVVGYAQKLFDSSKWYILIYTVIAAVYVASIPRKWIWFNWHPLSMIVSFILLSSFAALIKKIGGYENTKLHGYLMSGALALSSFGFYVIYSNKNFAKKNHFTTIHAKLGLGVLIGFLGVGIFGGVALHPDWGIFKSNKQYRSLHKWGGRALMAGAWLTSVLGFAEMESDIWKQAAFSLPLLLGAIYILQ